MWEYPKYKQKNAYGQNKEAVSVRIICVLYLVLTGRLDLPILYLSRYITHNKGEYYRLIQAIRDKNNDNATEWEAWIVFMLKGIEETAIETTRLVKGIFV